MSDPIEPTTPTSSKAAAGSNNKPHNKASKNLAPMEEHNCDFCEYADNSRMVQCDSCKCWCHYDCAGVTEDIENYDWVCLKCENAATNQQKKKASRRNTRGTVRKTNSSRVNARKTKTGKPKKAVKNSSSKDRWQNQEAAEQQKPQKCSDDEKPMGHEKNKSSKAKSMALDLPSRSTQTLKVQLKKLLVEETLMLEEMKKKPELMAKKFELMEELASSVCRSDAHYGSDDHSHESSDSDEANDEECSDTEEEYDGQDESFVPKKQSTPVRSQTRKTFIQEKLHSRVNGTLTREQVAARQVVSNDLPRFAGNPEEWPMFISTFQSTTTMCGYRDEENMIRLRNCLKDDALATVRSFLMHPSMVSKAISVLKLRFGQPHVIISTLRDKILAMAPVRSDSIEKLVDYALAVQNLCSTIDACGRKEYMRDVTLMQDLVSKLPPAIKLDWARHSKTLKKSNLVAFSDWIYSIAEDASIVADPRKSHGSGQDTRGKRQGKAFVNTHVESTSETVSRQKVSSNQTYNQPSENSGTMTSKICSICKGNCTNAAKCKRFLNLSYEARWAAVREFRICRKCLRQHGGNCNSKACGVNGCTFKHNPLLHKNLVAPNEPDGSSTHTTSNEERSVNIHQIDAGLALFRYLLVT